MSDEHPLRFRVTIQDITNGPDHSEVVHQATVVCADHAELATYLRKTATLVDRHGD
jgi:hypothetical protein